MLPTRRNRLYRKNNESHIRSAHRLFSSPESAPAKSPPGEPGGGNAERSPGGFEGGACQINQVKNRGHSLGDAERTGSCGNPSGSSSECASPESDGAAGSPNVGSGCEDGTAGTPALVMLVGDADRAVGGVENGLNGTTPPIYASSGRGIPGAVAALGAERGIAASGGATGRFSRSTGSGECQSMLYVRAISVKYEKSRADGGVWTESLNTI